MVKKGRGINVRGTCRPAAIFSGVRTIGPVAKVVKNIFGQLKPHERGFCTKVKQINLHVRVINSLQKRENAVVGGKSPVKSQCIHTGTCSEGSCNFFQTRWDTGSTEVVECKKKT